MTKDKCHEYRDISKRFRVLFNGISLCLSVFKYAVILMLLQKFFLWRTGIFVSSFLNKKMSQLFIQPNFHHWSKKENWIAKTNKKYKMGPASLSPYIQVEVKATVELCIYFFARCAGPFYICALKRSTVCDSECYFMIPISVSTRARANTYKRTRTRTHT